MTKSNFATPGIKLTVYLDHSESECVRRLKGKLEQLITLEQHSEPGERVFQVSGPFLTEYGEEELCIVCLL